LLFITDRKKIAISYLNGWFIIDLLSIMPFEFLLKLWNGDAENANINGILRVARIGKLYRLIKLTKLLRVGKMI
jgi:hypothetical protein